MTDLVSVIDAAFAADPEGAAVLVDEAVSNYVMDLLEANDAMLQAYAADEAQERTSVAKAALGRLYVSRVADGTYPDDDLLTTARYLAGIEEFISKARFGEMWNMNGKKKQVFVERDPATGRFGRVVDTQRKTSALGAGAGLSPAIVATGNIADGKYSDGVKDSPEEKRKLDEHQSQYEQASGHAKELYRQFGGDSKGIMVEMEVLRDGQKMQPSLSFPLSAARNGLPNDVAMTLNPLSDQIISLEVAVSPDASSAAQKRVARFNTFGYVGGDAATTALDSGSFKQTFGRRGVDESGSAVLFDRMRGASNILAATGNAKAAGFAGLVGTLGPEAEEVLGPYVRQSAYRYRGTEKTPDASLRQEFASQDMKSVRAIADGNVAGSAFDDEQGLRGRGIVTGAYLARRRDASGDQLALQVQSDVAAAHLARTLPTDSFTARLSEASGHVLPSQGVLIDADGKVVSQSVGYADDHYLPFNLKNMAALRGGQYVRTRVAGGLTGEDIYASVSSGARMATVVSSSGVFSLEFDPNFRGARGNSDKARQIYGRYLKILDAVNNSGMYLKDVSPQVYDDADRTARLLTSNLPASADTNDERTKIRNRILDEKRDEQRSGINPEEVQAEAEAAARKEPGFARLSGQEQARRVADVYDEIKFERQNESVQDLALNAAGYEVALKTLQQQFPYFIRNVSYEPLATGRTGREGSGFLTSRGADDRVGAVLQSSSRRDRGYTPAGQLRPSVGYKKPAASGATSSSSGGVSSSSTPKSSEEPKSPDAPSAPSAQRSAPLLDRLKLYDAPAKTAVNQAYTALNSTVSSVNTVQPAHDSWRDAVDSGDSNAMAAFLLKDPRELRSLIESDPVALRVASDSKAMTSAFRYLFGPSVKDDVIAHDSSMSEAFGGAKSSSDAGKYVVSLVDDLVSASNLINPFSGVGDDPFYMGAKPQLTSNLVGITNRAQLNAFEAGPGRAIALLPVPSDTESLFTALKGLPDAWEKARSEVVSNPASLLPKMAQMSGIPPEGLQLLTGKNNPGPSDFEPSAVAAQALLFQQARALKRVREVIDVMDPAGGGSPKVQPLAKGLSSRRVRVLPRDHPRSVDVMLRKAVGLPLV